MLKNATQMHVMLAAPFLLGVLFVFGTPLLSAPDELYHWQRAVQISEGHLFAQRTANGEWGGKIARGAFEYQIWFLKKFIDPKPIFVKDAWQEAKDLKPLSKERIEKPFPSTASFSPVAYIPQAAGIALTRAVGGNLFTQIIVGRLANLLAYFSLIAAAFRILPDARYIFVALASLPSALHLAASLNADAMNYAIPALLIALCMRCRADPAFRLSQTTRLLIAGLVVGCGLLKMIYVVFGLAVMLIPSAKFSANRARLIFIAACLSASLAAAVIWNLAFPFVPGVFWGNGADPAITIKSMIADPIHMIAMFAQTLSHWWGAWFLSYFAQIGGNGGFAFFMTDRTLLPTELVLVALTFADATRQRDLEQSFVLALIAFGFLLALLAAFLIGYTRVGSPLVEGINGRYLFLFYLLGAWVLASLGLFNGRLQAARIALFWSAIGLEAFVSLSALHWFQERWIY
jgi:uncharacterized membrane protein